jgi:glycosyltransferase involved in cell wall biosynthesis
MTLIDAFARLRESGDASPVLVVAGALPNGGSFSDYQRRARQCGVEHSIRARLEFIPAAETAAYFAAADIVVLPYERSFEAQSGVLMEAYAYGRPVVVTNVGAIGDTVRRDGTGEVVEPGDPEAMAVALRRLLADASRRATAASNMKVLADEKYSWSRIARLIEDVYEEARES